MAKKPVKTFHPIAVAKSLEAQNEAFGFLLAKIKGVAIHADTARPELMREWLKELGTEADRVSKLMWPDDEA